MEPESLLIVSLAWQVILAQTQLHPIRHSKMLRTQEYWDSTEAMDNYSAKSLE